MSDRNHNSCLRTLENAPQHAFQGDEIMILPSSPNELTVVEAAEFYIAQKTKEHPENTIYSYKKDLSPFVTWTVEEEIEYLADLDSWKIKQYETYVKTETDWNLITVNNRLGQLKRFLKYFGDDLWDGYLHPAVDVPDVDRSDEVNTKKYDKKDCLPQLAFLRDSTRYYGTFGHAALECQWATGRRGQAILALDLDDYVRYPDEDNPAEGPYLDFKHRPDTDTRLKNEISSEEPVEISETVADVLDTYIERERWDKRDEHGRKPLFTTRQGRASMSKLRGANYLITQPCLRMRCPHGQQQESCEYRNRDQAGGCKSSRSPHRIRTGSIQWQLDCGIPPEDVSDRADATVGTINKHYDVPDDRRKMEERRREYTSKLDETIEEAGKSENEDGSEP